MIATVTATTTVTVRTVDSGSSKERRSGAIPGAFSFERQLKPPFTSAKGQLWQSVGRKESNDA
jgi:hypothetical protein